MPRQPRRHGPSFTQQAFARLTALPRARGWERHPYRIPLSDGIELAADLIVPEGASKGLLLVRTPYGRSGAVLLAGAVNYAGQGYSVLVVSSRGTFGSGGRFDAMRDEVRDGQEVVHWMRTQSWYPGRFATIGASYMAFTQWALMVDPPHDLATAVVALGPHDFSRYAWGTGAFELYMVAWAAKTGVPMKGPIGTIRDQWALARQLEVLYRSTPLAASIEDHVRSSAPWFREWMARPDLSDPFWSPMQLGDALRRISVPVLIQAGWLDEFVDQSIEEYHVLRERGVEVGLTVGRWDHMDLVLSAQRTLAPESIAWLDHHLAGLPAAPRPAPVRVQMSDSKQWRSLEAWPPPSDHLVLALHQDGRLASGPAQAGDRSFVFDPDDPTPARGGNRIQAGGYKDDSALAARRDVLVYESHLLPADLTVMGRARVSLSHSAEHSDADLFIRISDVDRRGRSTNVTETYRRVRAQGDLLELDLHDAAHTFRAGHRLRLLIAGGSMPHYPRNPGNGENPMTANHRSANRHTVHHGSGSALHLPITTGR